MYPGTVTRRLLPGLLVLPVVAVLAAGCGSGGSALSLDPVASAATKTQQTGTYSFDYTASMQVLGQQFSFTGNGQSDTANGRMQMSMDFDGLPAQLTQNGSTAEFVLADKVMYLKMPFLSAMLPAGKEWMKVDALPDDDRPGQGDVEGARRAARGGAQGDEADRYEHDPRRRLGRR
jgi:hypothetical protein